MLQMLRALHRSCTVQQATPAAAPNQPTTLSHSQGRSAQVCLWSLCQPPPSEPVAAARSRPKCGHTSWRDSAALGSVCSEQRPHVHPRPWPSCTISHCRRQHWPHPARLLLHPQPCSHGTHYHQSGCTRVCLGGPQSRHVCAGCGWQHGDRGVRGGGGWRVAVCMHGRGCAAAQSAHRAAGMVCTCVHCKGE